MNPVITLRRSLQVIAILAVATVLSSSVHMLNAQPPEQKSMPGQSMMNPDSDMMAMHQKMMAEHGKMMADMKATDAALADLVAKLKTAPQAQKVDLLSDIVTRLVAQQATLHSGMDKMHQMMGKGAMCPCMMKDQMGEKSMETPAQPK